MKLVNYCTACWYSDIPKLISYIDEMFIQMSIDGGQVCWLDCLHSDKRFFCCNKYPNMNLHWWLALQLLRQQKINFGWLFSKLVEKHMQLETRQNEDVLYLHEQFINWYILCCIFRISLEDILPNFHSGHWIRKCHILYLVKYEWSPVIHHYNMGCV